MKFFIYLITNNISGKNYVGVTLDLKSRMQQHKTGRGSKGVHEDILKHGEENFSFTHIASANSYDDAAAVEYALINKYDCVGENGYNKNSGGYCKRYVFKSRIEIKKVVFTPSLFRKIINANKKEL